MHKVILAGLLLSIAAGSANAMMSSNSSEASTVLNVSASFAEQRHIIERKLADGKSYAEISSSDRSLVREALARISTALGSSDGIAGLNEQQKINVHNDQETVNTILTKAGEQSRLVCERVEKVGTHRKTTLCLTVAERQRLRDRSQDTLRQVQSTTPQLGGN